jgi:hypothetical protein
VECKTNDPIRSTLANCEDKIHPLVFKILWTAAVRHLDLVASPGSHGTLGELHYDPLATIILEVDPSSPKGHDRIVELHNEIIEDLEKLTNQLPFPSIGLCDCPELLRQPSILLTNHATRSLIEYSKEMEEYLHLARTILNNPSGPRNVFQSLIVRGGGSQE